MACRRRLGAATARSVDLFHSPLWPQAMGNSYRWVARDGHSLISTRRCSDTMARTSESFFPHSSASARNRTSARDEQCATRVERASAFGGDRRAAARRCAVLPPTCRFGGSGRNRFQLGLPGNTRCRRTLLRAAATRNSGRSSQESRRGGMHRRWSRARSACRQRSSCSRAVRCILCHAPYDSTAVGIRDRREVSAGRYARPAADRTRLPKSPPLRSRKHDRSAPGNSPRRSPKSVRPSRARPNVDVTPRKALRVSQPVCRS